MWYCPFCTVPGWRPTGRKSEQRSDPHVESADLYSVLGWVAAVRPVHGTLTLSACQPYRTACWPWIRKCNAALSLQSIERAAPILMRKEIRCGLSSVSWHAHDVDADHLINQRIDGVKPRSRRDTNIRECVGPDSNGCLTTTHSKRYPILSGTRTPLAQAWVDILPES